MPPVLLDAHQLAKRLDARYVDVLKWARRDVIPSIKVGGRRYFDLKKVALALHQRSSATPELEAAR
jgi:hypothetical protein